MGRVRDAGTKFRAVDAFVAAGNNGGYDVNNNPTCHSVGPIFPRGLPPTAFKRLPHLDQQLLVCPNVADISLLPRRSTRA